MVAMYGRNMKDMEERELCFVNFLMLCIYCTTSKRLWQPSIKICFSILFLVSSKLEIPFCICSVDKPTIFPTNVAHKEFKTNTSPPTGTFRAISSFFNFA